MAVLVEAISVIVRRDSINSKYHGGWPAFVEAVPNATLCADEEVARVGFMSPGDVAAFIKLLELRGLKFLDEGKPVDLAVADQQRGLTTECDWLEFAKLGKVSACWFFDGPRFGFGVHFPRKSMSLATPPGWEYENSLSQTFGFVPTEQINDRLQFIRTEGASDVFFDLDTGKEVFVGRTSGKQNGENLGEA